MKVIKFQTIISAIFLLLQYCYGMNFLSRQGIELNGLSVKFTKLIKNPLTTSVTIPIRRSSSQIEECQYTVNFKIKNSRTAIGFLSKPTNDYMTPQYMTDANIYYISMGGAGYIYPKCKSATRGYSNGDSVSVQLDFQQNIVKFFVNGDYVGSDDWKPSIDDAYFSISSEPGDVEVTVSQP